MMLLSSNEGMVVGGFIGLIERERSMLKYLHVMTVSNLIVWFLNSRTSNSPLRSVLEIPSPLRFVSSFSLVMSPSLFDRKSQ